MRETAAQALGAAVRPLPPTALPALLGALRQLSECPAEWEVRHGGLLGLKYVMAARTAGGAGVGAALLEAVLPAAVVGLQVGTTVMRGLGFPGGWARSRVIQGMLTGHGLSLWRPLTAPDLLGPLTSAGFR